MQAESIGNQGKTLKSTYSAFTSLDIWNSPDLKQSLLIASLLNIHSFLRIEKQKTKKIRNIFATDPKTILQVCRVHIPRLLRNNIRRCNTKASAQFRLRL
jgi:hypothetical protein